MSEQMFEQQPPSELITTGIVTSLDRGYPLVKTNSAEVRAQHAIDLVKNAQVRAVVGDIVDLVYEIDQDTPYISRIHPRTSILARREMVESLHQGSGKAAEQILAANFDTVYIVQSLGKRHLDLDYLERQLVMAHQSGAEVVVLLTKLDIAKYPSEDIAAAKAVAPGSEVLAISLKDGTEGTGLVWDRGDGAFSVSLLGSIPPSVPAFIAGPTVSASGTGVLLGRSGVGKSTLINKLLGEERLETGSVRQKDNAGRHTTVARKLVELPDGGALIDTPGLRSIGIYGAQQGLESTFAEITAAAANCRYRNCTHDHEPGCAVIAAVAAGDITQRRLKSYRNLAAEVFD